jgi:hypothetical protein
MAPLLPTSPVALPFWSNVTADPVFGSVAITPPSALAICGV